MNRFQKTVGIIGAFIGLVTALYIVLQFATKGGESSRMSHVLDAEVTAFTPPATATLVRRNVAWEPGRAHATEYYNVALSPEAIKKSYVDQLVSRGWVPGPMPLTRPLTEVAVVYHKDDREFRLSFGPPNGGWIYSISLMWGH